MHSSRRARGIGPRAPVAIRRALFLCARIRPLCAGGALAFVLPAAAQLGAPGERPDLNELALTWARGEFASPLLCEIDGRPVRGARRLLVKPHRGSGLRPENRLRLFPLDVEAERCFNALGSAEPDAEGTLAFSLSGPSRPDTARHDFMTALKRSRGFEFDIREGRLRIERVGSGEEARIVDFARGTLHLRLVPPGSDTERRLAEFEAHRKLLLTLEAGDGTELVFPLVQYGLR